MLWSGHHSLPVSQFLSGFQVCLKVSTMKLMTKTCINEVGLTWI